MLNSWYSLRIWKPTPFVPPKTSVSASTFQATAKDIRIAAKMKGTSVGMNTSRRICWGERPKAWLILTSDWSTPRIPSATLIAM